MVKYEMIPYTYAPVLILLLLLKFKDRFTPANLAIKSQNWSLIPGIIYIGIERTFNLILSLLNRLQVLENFSFKMFNWNVAGLAFLCVILILVYIQFHYIYKMPVIEVFNLKISYLPFILKFCGITLIVISIAYYFIGFDFSFEERAKLETIKSMDLKETLVYYSLSLIVGPVVEEITYRGLIYGPLYRKVGRWGAIILSSLLWTQGHFVPLKDSVGIFIIGILLAWLYDRKGSLLHPIIFHMFRNGWILIYFLINWLV